MRLGANNSYVINEFSPKWQIDGVPLPLTSSDDLTSVKKWMKLQDTITDYIFYASRKDGGLSPPRLVKSVP